MKVDDLRVLEAEELRMRLRTSRRELYELRFKHAVGQLENSSQISKVRHDIARIMTVLRERDLGIAPQVEEQPAAVAVAEEPAADEEEQEEAPKPKRGRGRAGARAGRTSEQKDESE